LSIKEITTESTLMDQGSGGSRDEFGGRCMHSCGKNIEAETGGSGFSGSESGQNF